MSVTKIETEAEKIVEEIIKICIYNKVNNRNIMDIIESLISNEMKNKKIELLSYIPSILAKKGYDIIKTDPLELKEY